MRHVRVAIALAICASMAACGYDAPASGSAQTSTSAAPNVSGDQAFRAIARDAIDDQLRRHPSAATDLGVHTYDRQFEDFSETAMAAESKAVAGRRARVSATAPAALSVAARRAREQPVRAIDAPPLR